MDFLFKWLLDHTDVEVMMHGVKDYYDNYICIKMCHKNGYKFYNVIPERDEEFLKVILDEMYLRILMKGESDPEGFERCQEGLKEYLKED